MSLTSIQFIGFLIAGCILFYIIPKKLQWICLLAMSVYFFCYGGWQTLGYIAATTITIWASALLLGKVDGALKSRIADTVPRASAEEKKQWKKNAKHKKQIIFWGTLTINFGILAFFKYAGFTLENLFGSTSLGGLILPLGISFYTFQAVGYLIDVYWGKIQPDKNLLKFALFVSFFPQLIQGPIGRYSDLAAQLYDRHSFDLEKIERAVLRMLWGYFKKMLIADRAAFVVNTIFDQPDEFGGAVAIVGALFYAIQQYADFSGGIDIVIGVGELFGIRMMENFIRPYFSRSLAEFWRRWHISLGAWMRDYVFYPLAMTSAMRKFGQKAKKAFGEHIGKVAPVALGNIVVFFLVGIWHGAQGHYILWGLYNGIIIAASALMEPLFSKAKSRLKINDGGTWFVLFGILRTFLIVTFGGFFDRGISVKAAFSMIGNTFFNFQAGQLSRELFLGFGLDSLNYIVLFAATAVLFLIEFIQEKKKTSIREAILKKPILIRWAILYLFIFAVVAFPADTSGGGGFMYAQF